MPPPSPPVGRLAPSPTGHLHLGHARSFLLAWWHARSRGGRVVLRIEDLDRSRVKPGMVEETLEDLAWLGLDWDGPARLQSEGEPRLRGALRELETAGHLYACVCTRKEVERAASAPHVEDGSPRYPGTCRGRYASLDDARERTGREPALRFRAPAGALELRDELHGAFASDVQREVGDFPVSSRDGQISYQLAVVVDDAFDGVTEVLRGDDLLSSTGRQALLQRALGLAHPRWIHVPLVVDGWGRRLAKRADDLALAHLRSSGVPSEAVVAWAARSAAQECGERATAAELLPGFRLELLPRSPAVLDEPALAALLATRHPRVHPPGNRPPPA